MFSTVKRQTEREPGKICIYKVTAPYNQFFQPPNGYFSSESVSPSAESPVRIKQMCSSGVTSTNVVVTAPAVETPKHLFLSLVTVHNIVQTF